MPPDWQKTIFSKTLIYGDFRLQAVDCPQAKISWTKAIHEDRPTIGNRGGPMPPELLKIIFSKTPIYGDFCLQAVNSLIARKQKYPNRQKL